MRIGVVGFGVAGSTASALLADAGHEVTVFERAPVLEPVGAGVLLQPSGQRVLERLGLLERVRAGAARIDELVALAPSGRTISRLCYGDLEPGLHALGVHRSDLHSALAELASGAGASVRHGEEIAGADDERLRGVDLIVGADGSRSALRAGSGLVRWEHEYAWGAAARTWLRGAAAPSLHGPSRSDRRRRAPDEPAPRLGSQPGADRCPAPAGCDRRGCRSGGGGPPLRSLAAAAARVLRRRDVGADAVLPVGREDQGLGRDAALPLLPRVAGMRCKMLRALAGLACLREPDG